MPVRATSEALEASIEARADLGPSLVVGLSVRSLFDALLAVTSATRPVVMSAVTIVDMAALVQAHDCQVRPVDIDLETLAPSPSSVAECCADDAGLVVLAHLYGSRMDVARIAQESAAPDRLIVEDCAQAFNGKLILSAGADVALYSFGPIKVATALGGAVGVFRDAELAAKVRRHMNVWPRMPENWFQRRVLKFAMLKLASTGWIYSLIVAVLAATGRDPDAVIGSLARGFSHGRPITESVRHRPPLRLLRLLDRRLRNWRPGPDATPALLDRIAATLPVPGIGTKPGRWWLAPVLTRDPDLLVRRLREKSIDATRGATSMRALEDRRGRRPGNAGRLIDEIVYLPKPTTAHEAVSLAQNVEDALNG